MDFNDERTRNDVGDLPQELHTSVVVMVGDRTASGSAPQITTTAFRPRGRRFRVGAQLHGRDFVTTRIIAYLPPYHLQTPIPSLVPGSQTRS